MNKKKKQKKRELRNKNKGTIPVYAMCDCGCCKEELRFFSQKTALEALKKAGLGNFKTIVDDLGVAHEGLDTFYGFALNE